MVNCGIYFVVSLLLNTDMPLLLDAAKLFILKMLIAILPGDF